MTKEEQSIFIAKTIGLEVISDPCGPISLTKSPYGLKRDVFYPPEAVKIRRGSWPKPMSVKIVPSYPDSLEKMHEVEEWLIKKDITLWLSYSDELRRICDRTFGFACCAYHATAAHRAEAFIKIFTK